MSTIYLKLSKMAFHTDFHWALIVLLFIFINSPKCSNQFKYIIYADYSTLSICILNDIVVDSGKLINDELNCIDR